LQNTKIQNTFESANRQGLFFSTPRQLRQSTGRYRMGNAPGMPPTAIRQGHTVDSPTPVEQGFRNVKMQGWCMDGAWLMHRWCKDDPCQGGGRRAEVGVMNDE